MRNVRFVVLLLAALISSLCLSYAHAQDNEKGYTWQDGFLERGYAVSQEHLKKTMDGIFAKCAAVETTFLEEKKGTIVSWGVGDKNGKWRFWNGVSAIKDIDIKDGGVVIAVKTQQNKDTITVGFKVGDGDRKSSEVLHSLLAGKLKKYGSPDKISSEDTKGVQYLYFALAAYTEPGGNVGMITETFLAKPHSATSRDLQELARATSASGWPSVKEETVHFGPSIGKGKPVVAKWGKNSLSCPVQYQDVAYLATDGKKKALRLLIYSGCPFEIKSLTAEKHLSLRKANEIIIESAHGRILIPQKDSLVPFLATKSSLVYLCWNTLGASLKFLHAGTVFETEDAKYKVLKDGARICFDEKKGVVLDGIQKIAKR